MSKKRSHLPPQRNATKSPSPRSEPRPAADRTQTGPKAPGPTGLSAWFSPGALREFVESVVIAFVLAFLFRTFEAEAFVIPTGSMAPTLMGRHKDLVCAKCGYSYQVTASAEVDSRTSKLYVDEQGRQTVHIVAGTCPMCRFTMDLAPGNPQQQVYRSFKGDRILVAKFPYHLSDPERWDVAVFMYPGEAKTNYIKRLVGKPSETLRLYHGDVFVKPDGKEEFAIARKPPQKILAMVQPVYDNDYVLAELVRKGWPVRWGPGQQGSARGCWQTSEDLKSFHADGTSPGEAWLEYRHYAPTYQDWQDLLEHSRRTRRDPKPQLITDFAAYNTEHQFQGVLARRSRDDGTPGLGPPPRPDRLGLHWVGDLVLECTVQAESGTGQFLLALVEGGRFFLCEVDLSTGAATLAIPGLEGFRPTAKTAMRGPGKHHVRLANVDDELTLWVDGCVVKFDAPTTYDSAALDNSLPQLDDLAPARIGSRGAAVQVSHVRLFRDVYYIAQRYSRDGPYTSPMNDYEIPHGDSPFQNLTADSLAALFSDPTQWDLFHYRRRVDFSLGKDQFLMLGDNSAESKDSRLWESDRADFFVHRELLKGKAVWIYWPHSWDRIPGSDKLPFLSNGIWFPLFPNFARMGFVR